MARNTDYTLYKTGRTDPSFKNIWAFESDAIRTAWLNSCSPMNFPNNKYWRTGATIKCSIRYEESFNYDYVRIINRLGEVESTKTWFCFITGRTYISNNCTLFTLAVDYPQTFLFNSDGSPFWKTYGFIETATIENPAPNRGQGAEFSSPAKQCQSIWYNAGTSDFAIVVFSTVDLTVLMTSGEIVYNPMDNGGVYMASVPFVINGVFAGEIFTNTISKLNELGLTEAVSGAYCVPGRYFSEFTDETWARVLQPKIDIDTIYIQPITSIEDKQSEVSYTPTNKVLLRGDYSVIVVNNCQGETSLYHFEDFIGIPTFKTTVSMYSGAPTIMMWPGDNYKYGDSANFRQHIMKITSPISCSYLNDNYKIWLAQNSNQRTAALNAAQMGVDHANQAAQRSLNYNISAGVNFVGNNLSGFINSAIDEAYVSEDEKSDPFRRLTRHELADFTDRYLGVLGTGQPTVGIWSKAAKDPITGTLGRQNIVNTYIEGVKSAVSAVDDAVGKGWLNNISEAFIRKQLGIEQAYVYEQAIEKANANLQRIQAFYADKEVIPSTALGSNAHGDLVLFNQFNFMISVITPTLEWAVKIDKLLSSSGCMVNNLGDIIRRHQVFDYYKCESPRVLSERNGRPQYARNMLISLLQNGVYFWYYNNGDISEYIGLPYDISNPTV